MSAAASALDSPSAAAPPPPAAQAFGPFLLDRAGARLLREGRPVDIAPRPFAVLELLAARAGRLVTKDELLDTVWGHRFVSDSVLKVAINGLRSALGEDARAPQWVHTVARRGYRFGDDLPVAQPGREGPGIATGGPGAAEAPAEATWSASAAPAIATPGEGPAVHSAGPSTGLATEPAATAPAPAEAARAPAAGNLPRTLGTLIGRADDQARLAGSLQAHRLVTLTGPGGVGKTRLALATAGLAPPPDGVWLVRLDALASADALPAELARTLGLPDSAGRGPEALARALAPLQLRLVLDNAEHLADALAPPLSAWLQAAPGLRVLVTSQRALRVAGEQVQPLAPLPVPAADADAASCLANPAVALLLERVRSADPHWAATPADLHDALHVGRALDGLPLALELAAARVPLLGLRGVRERLGERLRLLTRGAADAPGRHRTLRAALEWSVGLLPDAAAQVLERLSVFVSGFTLEAACAVAAPALPGGDEFAVLDTLEQLRDLALLVAADAPAATPPRLRMFDSVRLLAAERLARRGGEAAAQQALRAWLTNRFAVALERATSTPQEPWLAPLEPEAGNLQAAMTHGLAALQRGSAAAGAAAQPAGTDIPWPDLHHELAALASASAIFCCRAGLKHLCGRWADTLRDAAAQQPQAPLACSQPALDTLTTILASPGLIGAPAVALEAAERAWPVLRAQAGPGTQQYFLFQLGQIQLRLGRLDALEATVALMRERVPALASTIERRWPAWMQASLERSRGNIDAYAVFWTETLRQMRQDGERLGCWQAAIGLGQALFLQGRLDDAVDVLDQAVDEIRAAGRQRAFGLNLAQAVVLRLMRDADPPTLQRLREAVQVLQADGMVWWLADALAWVPLWQGRLADARRVQAWADGLVAARGEQRGPVFSRLRRTLAERLPDAQGEQAEALDEAGALRLADALAPRVQGA